MKNIKYLFLISTCLFISNEGNAELNLTFDVSNIPLSNHTLHTHHTPVELKPISNFTKLAAVCAIGNGGCDGMGFNKNDDNLNLDLSKQCLEEGYTYNNCNSPQIPNEVCPHNKSYGKGCTCRSDWVTCSDLQTGIGTSCNGKYSSCSCKSDLVTCSNLQIGVGASCDGKYASCQCQSGLISCSSNQIGIGTACDGKYSSCKCPNSWTTCTYGGANTASKCTLYGIDYWSECGSAPCSAAYCGHLCVKDNRPKQTLYENINTGTIGDKTCVRSFFAYDSRDFNGNEITIRNVTTNLYVTGYEPDKFWPYAKAAYLVLIYGDTVYLEGEHNVTTNTQFAACGTGCNIRSRTGAKIYWNGTCYKLPAGYHFSCSERDCYEPIPPNAGRC